MHTTTAKKDKNIVSGKLPKVGTGHKAHQTGAGTHKHKCERRMGNRKQNSNRIISEY